MAFEIGVVPENWRYAMIVPLYKCEGERTKYNNYREGVRKSNHQTKAIGEKK